MENQKKNLTIDPDYQSYKSALELNEEEEKNAKLKKIRKIIEEEYDKEIANKLEQTKQITIQICKVRKLLDLVRNVSINQYYNKKELEYNEEETTNPDLIITPDKQNRIHPAVKKLLGNNTQNLDCLYMNTKRKRNNTTNSRNYNLKEKLDDNSSPKTKISKLDDEIPIQTTTPIVEQQLNNQNDIKIEPIEVPLDTIKKRNKIKRRIVIGNLSKSISTSEDSKLTRKWMVYVQGPKQKEDVSDFIEKVIFYLHSSYKPYDVVEVCRHPIHLQRPGWGEFKIKLEIFFKNKLNKPVILEHDLKFKDHFFNGRETLGSETIVDLFLYEDTNSFKDISIKNEPIKLEDLISTNYEHNYCHGDNYDDDVKIKTENGLDLTKNFSMEHDYSLPPSQQNSPKIQKIKNENNQNCDNNNDLIYGLNQSYLDPPIKDCQVNSLQTEKILIPLNELNDFLQVHQKDIQFNNNKTKIIIFGKRIDNNNIIKLTNNIYNDNRINFKINLFNHKFKNVGEALPYLFKRLPLITDLANNTNYKRLFPFTAKTLEEYHSWNVGKRRNAEWSLARTIRNLLRHNKIYDSEKWSTKTILMYGRSHCYIPSNNYNLFHRDSEEKQLLLSCLSNSNLSVQMKINNSRIKTEPDIDVDVDSNMDIKESSIKRNSNCIDISDPQLRHHCSFIRETALDCNIVLKTEELYDGIVMNCAERMILEAVKCLADSLIRRAHNYKVCHMDYGCKGGYVSLDDVQAVIDERPEMIAITRFKNKRSVLEKYF